MPLAALANLSLDVRRGMVIFERTWDGPTLGCLEDCPREEPPRTNRCDRPMPRPDDQLPRLNLEIKFRVADLEPVRQRALAAGASPQWRGWQEDVFFAVPRGRLKLRRQEGQVPQLVAYLRKDSPEIRESRYVIASCADSAAVEQALRHTIGVAASVRKLREVYSWRGIRIHLDRVEGLGEFVELEAVVEREGDPLTARRDLEELVEHLGLGSAESIPVAYVDLISSRER